MDAVELMIAQHREIERLLEMDQNWPPAQLDTALAKMADAVALHLVVEERHLYRALRSHSTLDDVFSDDHLVLKRALVRLLQLDPVDPRFSERLRSFRALLLTHFHEEETALFPQMKALLFEKDLTLLAEAMTGTTNDLSDGEPRYELLAEPAVAAPLQ